MRRKPSRVWRGVGVGLALLMFTSTSASGLSAILKAAAEEAQSRIVWPARHFSDAPGVAFKGDRPGRDAARSGWWTPQLRRDLARVEFQREFDRRIERGDWLASIAPLALMQGMPPGGGEGGGTPGEGSGGSGGSGSGGTSGGGGGYVPGSGGGLGGETNTNTGNKLSTLGLAGWSSRGESGVAFTLCHNSLGAYDDVFGHGWSHSYSASIDYTAGSSAIIRMPDGLTVPYTETGGAFSPPAGWNAGLVRNAGGDWTLTFKNGWMPGDRPGTGKKDRNDGGHISNESPKPESNAYWKDISEQEYNEIMGRIEKDPDKPYSVNNNNCVDWADDVIFGKPNTDWEENEHRVGAPQSRPKGFAEFLKEKGFTQGVWRGGRQ